MIFKEGSQCNGGKLSFLVGIKTETVALPRFP